MAQNVKKVASKNLKKPKVGEKLPSNFWLSLLGEAETGENLTQIFLSIFSLLDKHVKML